MSGGLNRTTQGGNKNRGIDTPLGDPNYSGSPLRVNFENITK